jgi:hypothetical protein
MANTASAANNLIFMNPPRVLIFSVLVFSSNVSNLLPELVGDFFAPAELHTVREER